MDNIVITIARQYGSGGRTVGKRLAEDLGFNYYSNEIVQLASEDSGISEELFAKYDERIKKSFFTKLSPKVYKGELFPPDSGEFSSQPNIFNYQAKIIKEIADKGSSIIIGRCADYILRDYPNVMSVFVYADKAFCEERAMEINGFSLKEVRELIRKTDKYRADYYKYYTGHEWNDARNYDLCLDSGKLGFDKVMEIIKAYMEIRFNR